MWEWTVKRVSNYIIIQKTKFNLTTRMLPGMCCHLLYIGMLFRQ